jgi:hypothetical protein
MEQHDIPVQTGVEIVDLKQEKGRIVLLSV